MQPSSLLLPFPLLRSPPPPLNAPCAQGGACARQAPGAHGAQRARAAVQGLQPRGAIERVDKPPPLPPPASRPPPNPQHRHVPRPALHKPSADHPPSLPTSPLHFIPPYRYRPGHAPLAAASAPRRSGSTTSVGGRRSRQRRCGRSGRRSMASTRTGAGAGRAGCPAARGRRARS